jgi:hypothetical protein
MREAGGPGTRRIIAIDLKELWCTRPTGAVTVASAGYEAHPPYELSLAVLGVADFREFVFHALGG